MSIMVTIATRDPGVSILHDCWLSHPGLPGWFSKNVSTIDHSCGFRPVIFNAIGLVTARCLHQSNLDAGKRKTNRPTSQQSKISPLGLQVLVPGKWVTVAADSGGVHWKRLLYKIQLVLRFLIVATLCSSSFLMGFQQFSTGLRMGFQSVRQVSDGF